MVCGGMQVYIIICVVYGCMQAYICGTYMEACRYTYVVYGGMQVYICGIWRHAGIHMWYMEACRYICGI